MLFTYIAMTLIAQNQNAAAFSSDREDCSCIKCEFQCDIRNGSECISSGNAWRSKKTIRVAASAEGDRCIRSVGFSALRRPVPGGIEGSENAEADRPLWSVCIRSDSVENSPMVICKSWYEGACFREPPCTYLTESVQFEAAYLLWRSESHILTQYYFWLSNDDMVQLVMTYYVCHNCSDGHLHYTKPGISFWGWFGSAWSYPSDPFQPRGRNLYTEVERPCAGWKTPFVRIWANQFYAHRQCLWVQLLNKEKQIRQRTRKEDNGRWD